MKKIVFKLNAGDTFSIQNATFEVDLTSKKEYSHTFFNKFKRLYKMPHFFQNEALDLWYISLMVYYADKTILRKGTYDNWTRQIKLYIPVLEIEKWEANKEILIKTLSYLSGDLWDIEFRKRDLNNNEVKISKKIPTWFTNDKFETDAFCMLSGGLDSFIGAIDLLTENKKVAFVGHYGGGKGVKPFQDKVNNTLKEKFKIDEKYFFNFHAAPVNGKEDSTRTRSFMFFTHAIILASCMKKKITLYIPENGLISLNIPLTNSRLGSSSTRTTHPYYMEQLQALLNNLNIDVTLHNPFQFLTKGEMLLKSKDVNFIKDNYSFTMSCSHPDQVRYVKGPKPTHCGTCLPCTIRRASILKAFKQDNTIYSDSDYKNKGAKTELKSFKIGISDYKNNKLSKFTIQIAGKLSRDIDKYSDLYKRGMDELAIFLDSKNE